MKNDSVYVAQILVAVKKIEAFTAGLNDESFSRDEKTQSAVIMQLTLIGEIAKKISEETRNRVALPWKDISGFRDKAIHNYFNIDLDVVWNTVVMDLPILKKQLEDNRT